MRSPARRIGTIRHSGEFALYQAACDRSRAVIDGADGLDQRSVKIDKREPAGFSLRWILLHMIEETARHNGHADLLREAIDGAVGEWRISYG